MIDPAFWTGRQVFLTGHTGFKGAWAALLLNRLGADVHGYALPPECDKCLFAVSDVEKVASSKMADIRDPDAIRRAMEEAQPEIVIHMAAQSLVRRSYAEPLETISTNILGTANLLEAIRHVPGVLATVIVTSDKCYEEGTGRPAYRETDPLGGFDPYSSSKGCAELIAAAYRNSYFPNKEAARIASARAGNVIGGGDWASDRLVPDAMRAFLSGETLLIRNATAVRPWQHVLDPVIAYLLLAERLASDAGDFDEAWNFGPSPDAEITVEKLVEELVRRWGDGARWEQQHGDQLHESASLKLDCSKARESLGWQSLIALDQALDLTVDWYRGFQSGTDLHALTLGQIDAVLESKGQLPATATAAS